MKLDNTLIHKPTKPVQDTEFEKCAEIGRAMRAFAKENEYACLCANQVGYEHNICVIHDNEKSSDGYTTYFNSEVLVPDGAEIGDTRKEDIDLVSFPRKKIIIPVNSGALVSAYSVDDEDRIDLDLDEGELSLVWWVVNYCLGGVCKDDVMQRDYRTVRKTTPKRKPNARCEECGRKNKICICEDDKCEKAV
jgi:hypothetical protein